MICCMAFQVFNSCVACRTDEPGIVNIPCFIEGKEVVIVSVYIYNNNCVILMWDIRFGYYRIVPHFFILLLFVYSILFGRFWLFLLRIKRVATTGGIQNLHYSDAV